MHVTTGGFVSTTVTVVLQLLVLWAMSVAVHVTVVVPSGKVPPDPGHVTTAAPQLSLAVAENVADSLWVPLPSTGSGAEHAIFGGSRSAPLTVPGHVAEA